MRKEKKLIKLIGNLEELGFHIDNLLVDKNLAEEMRNSRKKSKTMRKTFNNLDDNIDKTAMLSKMEEEDWSMFLNKEEFESRKEYKKDDRFLGKILGIGLYKQRCK